jgi:hypothetical protein
MHALANELNNEGFWSRIKLDQDNRVTHVMFAHPKSLEYLKAYPDVVILDCTYKTNKYRMPLLDIVGVDACQRSFCIAFAFLAGEEESDYIWAMERLRSIYELAGARLPSVMITDRCLASMNAIEQVFPETFSLLCLWHINKAILRRCQPSFIQGTQDAEGVKAWDKFYGMWHTLAASHNEETYTSLLNDFKKEYLTSHTAEVGYILETWLDLHKEKIIKAWVNQQLHFGNTVSSRGEGIHKVLKEYLKTSVLDLFEAWRSIKLAVTNQIRELEARQARQQITTPIELSGALYSIVRGWISHEALRMVEQQRQRLKGDLPACTNTVQRSQGIPCAHILKDLIDQQLPLQLLHFHTHWLYRREGAPSLMIEPLQQRDDFAARSRLPKTTTHREPSAFEAVEVSVRRRAPPTCSNCGIEGHTLVSKKCLLRYSHLITPATTAPAAPELGLPTTTPPAVPVSGPPASPPGAAAAPEPEITIFVSSTPPPTTAAAPASPESSLPFDHPRSIFKRYCTAREKWYASLPRGTLKTDQQYRKAHRLPLRYGKAQYDWCLDYKQMGKQYMMQKGQRD